MQDLLKTSVVQVMAIILLSVVCSFLLLLVIIYPWLPNIYNAISISYYLFPWLPLLLFQLVIIEILFP